ncbi:hypothetical protein ACWJJH_02305 [Endozoicomonadaceae bacterium StTr2]
MSELASRKRPGVEIAIAVFAAIVFCLLVSMEGDSIIVAIAVSSAMILAAVMQSLYFYRKPAAWVQDGVLHLKAWPLNITRITLSEVEQATYETGHKMPERGGYREFHQLKLKLENRSEWVLTVTDQTEYIQGLRLYKYLQQSLPQVKLVKLSSHP